MKKHIIFIGFILIFVSCDFSKEVKYYPSKKLFKINKMKELNGIPYEDFKKGTGYFAIDSLYFYTLKNNRKIAFLPESTGLVKRRNVLRIYNDSVFSALTDYSIKELPYVLKEFYLNRGQKHWLSDTPDKAGIIIELSVYEDKINFEKTLNALTKEFDDLNDNTNENLELYIILERPLPPPLPPSKK